jgi:thiol-disulfide isomerase/thioredoxin
LLLRLPAQAFVLTITGSAKGLPEVETINLRCSAWIEDKVFTLGEGGTFAFQVEYDYPAMFTLVYGLDYERLEADIFLVADLTAEVEMVAEPENEKTFLRVPDRRSVAFKKAKEYVEGLFVAKTTSPSVLDGMTDRILSEPYIGDDLYTKAYATASKLDFIHQMVNLYGKKIEPSVFEMDEFADLPRNDARFMGFAPYMRLMIAWNEFRLTDEMERHGKSVYDFKDWMATLDAHPFDIPDVVRFGIIANKLNRFPYDLLPDTEKELYREKLVDLTRLYPENRKIEDLLASLYEIYRSLENNPAPQFVLVTPQGDVIQPADFLGKFLLIDVWGSWCRPCREKHPALKELYGLCKEYDFEVEFLGVAEEKDTDAWQQAIQQDQLSWPQVLADSDFLGWYRIEHYPTMILVDQNGIVRKVASDITMDDLIFYMYTVNE